MLTTIRRLLKLEHLHGFFVHSSSIVIFGFQALMVSDLSKSFVFYKLGKHSQIHPVFILLVGRAIVTSAISII